MYPKYPLLRAIVTIEGPFGVLAGKTRNLRIVADRAILDDPLDEDATDEAIGLEPKMHSNVSFG